MMNNENKVNVKFIGFKAMGEWSVAELQTFASSISKIYNVFFALSLKDRIEDKQRASFEEWLEAYKETVKNVSADYPNLSLIGTQWRGAENADLIHWGAVLYDALEKKFYAATVRRNIPIKDRTGGGDSFASGVLSALLLGKDLQTAVEWGAAHGILVQETPGDFTMVTLKDIEKEVKRAQAGGGVKADR